MCPVGYYTVLRQSKNRTYLRFEMVRYAKEFGIKAAARHFSMTVKTVRKWLRRWQPGSLKGLSDLGRAPLHPRQGVTAKQRHQAIRLKEQLPLPLSRLCLPFSIPSLTRPLPLYPQHRIY
jgi:transposase-like protein